ncbi:diaminopimelate epimerase [Enterobacteriaceae endosymbiont of Neohaemonia nigricornis]|uniref:diaminopimelate epimerase n=1 Tax=Enterobacteriaceae endosymbiont of Neohaemonia nigricornis TaxID=2675792 RepID=UPI001449626E|nr:diaminopimelate epimerase [Enterobacteriaceae endosymbiont of Neohaemonia nigricornis]QJC30390.1 diaminopimelate epimerase [Enterobacteriaceae endosymbiont of Neohaemonia nigricornis]
MQIKFTKMQALNNDFIIINNINYNITFTKNIIQNLSNRYTGIGFDQLLILDVPKKNNIDFHYRIFNANGNEVEQCGNGARCLALYLKKKKLIKKNTIYISTNNRILILKIMDNNLICVNMGKPLFLPKDIPFITDTIQENYRILFKNKYIYFNIVSIGNPHCVITVKNISTFPVNLIGSFIENHIVFPKKINVNFMEIINNKHIKLRVFERDIGETNACGSGACATVAVGIKKNILSNKVRVTLLGGDLNINWNGKNNNLFMFGTAHHVYDGVINI